MKNTPTPGILLTATLRWAIAARLAIVFSQLGCRVEVICPGQHPATKTRAIRRTFPYSWINPLGSLRDAIASSEPDIIIPCDDKAALHLHELYQCAEPHDGLRALISRSLGQPQACELATARGELIRLAVGEGIRVPPTTVVSKQSELTAALSRYGYPAVIKADCTWGGKGVAIVRNEKEAQLAFARMTSRPAARHTVVRTLLERDPSFVLNWLKAPRRSVTVQNFILGTPANRAVVCWQGKVLAGISVEAIHTQHLTGPATVVRAIDNSEMSEAVEKLIGRLGVSGLWGIDFILEASTGFAHLIEVNPRATPISHLQHATEQNLPVALYTQLTGRLPFRLPATMESSVIAMFPGEWHRNPVSPYLRSNYSDVPLNEPALIQDCLDKPWSERGLLARIWSVIKKKLPTSSAPVQGSENVTQTATDAVFKYCATAPTVEKTESHHSVQQS